MVMRRKHVCHMSFACTLVGKQVYTLHDVCMHMKSCIKRRFWGFCCFKLTEGRILVQDNQRLSMHYYNNVGFLYT